MHDGLEHSMSVDWDRRRRFESPRGQMCFSTFYKNKNTIKDVDHPCSACAKCIKNRLYDPDPCEVCSQWLKHIKENSVEAESSGSRWVKMEQILGECVETHYSAKLSRSWGWYAYMGGHWKVRPLEVFVAGHRPPTGHRPATLAKNAPLVSNTGLMISVTCVQMVDRN